MKCVLVGACALALLSGAAASAQSRADPRELIVSADLELQNLSSIRARTDDPAARVDIDGQIAAIRKWRDAVQVDAMAAPGSPDRARLAADQANLERAMTTGAAAMPQAPSPPPLLRRDTTPGAGGATPPSR
jgi:hypothetical protein